MSTLRNTQRVIRYGFTSFWRNKFVTASAVLVMTVTLFLMGSLLFLGAMLNSSLAQIEDKVDVNAYFTTEASEDQILRLRNVLESRDDVSSVEYVSQEQALEQFRSQHRDDDLIVQALEELEQNPLGAHINIQATNPDNYSEIAQYIENNASQVVGGANIIDKVNYNQNETAINRLSDIIQSINAFSFVVLIVFGLIAALIVFNTIRLAIFSSSEEISVMELMGASRAYIRGPFVIEGIMYGIVSALITLALFYPIALWGADFTESFFGTISSFDYYIDNFAQLFVILMVSGIGLGGISSYVAVRKYLDV